MTRCWQLPTQVFCCSILHSLTITKHDESRILFLSYIGLWRNNMLYFTAQHVRHTVNCCQALVFIFDCVSMRCYAGLCHACVACVAWPLLCGAGWVTGLTSEPQQMEAGPGEEVKMSKETQAKVAALRYTYGYMTTIRRCRSVWWLRDSQSNVLKLNL